MSSSVATEDRRSLTMSLIVTPEQANQRHGETATIFRRD